jgi:hypothetical protein
LNTKNIFRSDRVLLVLILSVFFLLLYVSFREFSDSEIHPSVETSKQAIIDNRNLLLSNKKLIEDNQVLMESSLKRDNSNYHLLNNFSGEFKVVKENQVIITDNITKLNSKLDAISKQLKITGQ